MIDSVMIEGANGSSVQLNLEDNVYPLTDWEVTYEARNDDTPREQGIGSWPAFDYLGTAKLHFEGDLLAKDAADYWNKRNMFMSPFIPAPEHGFRRTCRVITTFSGRIEPVQLDCNLDGGMPSLPLTNQIPAYGNWQINLVAKDPRWYSTNVQTAYATVTSGARGGLVFPFRFPIRFATTGQNKVSIFNSGNAPSDPVITVAGPATDPQFTIFRADGTIQTMALHNITVPDGTSLVVDFRIKKIVVANLYSAFRTKAPGSVWWQLYPGVNNVGFDAFNTGANTLASISWQNAYII